MRMQTRRKKRLLFFRIELAEQLVNNPYLPTSAVAEADGDGGVDCDGVEGRRSNGLRMEVDHDYVAAAPKNAKKYCNGRWILTDLDTYQRKTCSTRGCSERTRSFCSCTVGHWLCVKCYGNHQAEEALQTSAP